MIADDASKRQILSADPSVSTWLSANAGSGKTRVLTDRVARLLLTGASPQNILCLTYTKAAASEMQVRLFRRLGKWAMMGDTDLTCELQLLGAEIDPNPGFLSNARTLFARAIETPGGLRIQTIHSFCASLLRRFPLEAGVSPVFRELDDAAAKKLRKEVVDYLADGAGLSETGQLAGLITDEDFEKPTTEIARHRKAFASPATKSEIWAQFGLPDELSEAGLLADVFTGGEPELFADLGAALRASSKVTDQGAAKKLGAVNIAAPRMDDLARLFPVFLFGKDAKKAPLAAKVGSFPTQETRASYPEIVEPLNALMRRVEAVRERYFSLCSARNTLVLQNYASLFLPAYEARKLALGCLDFDDLIGRVADLLSDPENAQWVLYRLDGELDHILVDEAQDTSPDQWRVIQLLAQEFGAGQGARADKSRSVFVVGDLKQSIYSFQGADLRKNDEMRQHFSDRLGAAKQKLHERSLNHSFRSSPGILALVDAVFQDAGSLGIAGSPTHLAFHRDMPGRVDLWPVLPKADATEQKQWFDPTDKLAPDDHRIALAEKIANQIEELEKTGSIPDESGGFRRIQFDDFLILVQRRSEIFHQIIRACKSRNLPIAGADRLKIGAEMAVKDLQALLAFLAMPQDSLSLAATLRSPLFGISEADLFELAHHRHETDLWPALLRQKDRFPGAVEILTDLRNKIDFLKPFEILERILTRHQGRHHLLSRLGPEAEDGIDALLSQVIEYEHSEPASLTGFLAWMDADELEIKRQSDNVGNRIRVMTTHGAKGMESPIVILPDTGDRRPPTADGIVISDSGLAMWKARSGEQPECLKQALTKQKEAQQEERMRLLYVALTRAEKWLIVCAFGEIKDENSWYRLVESGMDRVGALPLRFPTGSGLRAEHGDWLVATPDKAPPDPTPKASLPDWATQLAATPVRSVPPVSPSELGGAKSLGQGDSRSDQEPARNYGSQIHRLLEHLPKFARGDWQSVAAQLLAAEGGQTQGRALLEVVDEAVKILENPAFSHLFGPGSLAEVDISACLPGVGSRRIRGTIDRLVVTNERVLIVDFKSNHQAPTRAKDVPDGILRQMAAYLGAIEQIYPGQRIETAILWTHTAVLMPLPHDIVRASLNETPHLDGGGIEP